VIVLAKPVNGVRIMRGDSEAMRENAGPILNGDPSSRPLFVAYIGCLRLAILADRNAGNGKDRHPMLFVIAGTVKR
jgi:hypothetical protein